MKKHWKLLDARTLRSLALWFRVFDNREISTSVLHFSILIVHQLQGTECPLASNLRQSGHLRIQPYKDVVHSAPIVWLAWRFGAKALGPQGGLSEKKREKNWQKLKKKEKNWQGPFSLFFFCFLRSPWHALNLFFLSASSKCSLLFSSKWKCKLTVPYGWSGGPMISSTRRSGPLAFDLCTD